MRLFTVLSVCLAICIMGLLALVPVLADNQNETITTAREQAVAARSAAEVERQVQRQGQMAAREAAWTVMVWGLALALAVSALGLAYMIAGLGVAGARFGTVGARVYWEVFKAGAVAAVQQTEPVSLPPSAPWGGRVLSSPTAPLVLPVGVDQDHNQITVPVDGTSSMMLIAGPSGLGKSSLLRAQVCAAADQGGAQIAVVNPKRMDLAVPEDSSLLFSPVAVYPEEITELLKGLVAELDRRNGVIASQGADLFSSIGMGVLLVFIDELSNVMEAANRSTRILLLNLIRSGRAAGIFVVAATQSPRASVITGEVKNAARTRVAMAMGPEESKLVLGNMAAASLPMEQGAAIYQDGMIPVPVRTVHVEGHAWRQRMDATRTGRPAAVLEVEPVQAETKEEKVERHLREGMPQYKVEELVYGHAGGNASRQVKKIKESLGL